MFKRSLALSLSPFCLFALCSCSGSKDLAEPVAAPEINNRIEAEQLWSVSTGGNDGKYSKLGPAVSGNTVYAASRSGDVYALNLLTGDRLWNIDLENEDENDAKGTAKISGGLSAGGAYVAAGTENGYVYVMNAASGKLLWKDYAEAEVLTAPTFSSDGNRLFVLNSRGILTAYDSLSGNRLWQSGSGTAGLRLRTQSRPVSVADDFVMIGTSGGRVLILDQSNGAVVNSLMIGNPSGANDLERVADVSSSPLLLDGNLYSTAYNSGFVWYSFKDRQLINRLAYKSSRNLAFDDDCFVITGDNGRIWCVSRQDGHEIWENSALANRNVSAPVIYGNYAVVADYEGYVYFISLADGRIAYMDDTDDTPVYTDPVVTSQGVLIQTSGGRLVLLRYQQGIAAAKMQIAQSEQAAGAAGISLAAYDDYSAGGITREALMERRAQAQRLVNEMEARQRQAAAQMAKYQRERAEYERQRAAYLEAQKKAEEEHRASISGFGLMPGVKSEADEDSESSQKEQSSDSNEPALDTASENADEKAQGFGVY